MTESSTSSKRIKPIISGLVAGAIALGGAGCKPDQIQTERSKLFNQEMIQKQKNIENTKEQLKKIEELNKKVNTGNVGLDMIIYGEILNSKPVNNIDPETVFPQAEVGMKISPNEYFSLQSGENFIYGKIKFAFLDRESGDLYHINGIFNYKDIGDHPLWVASEIKKAETKQSRYELLMYNDGENPLQVLNEEELDSKIKDNILNPDTHGTYNKIDLTTKKVIYPDGNYRIIPGTSCSAHFSGENSIVEYFSRSSQTPATEIRAELKNR